MKKIQQRKSPLGEGGSFIRKLDTALPGKHTKEIYNQLSKKEASILAQLRTGKSKLNDYLKVIGASESENCLCGEKEDVKHFLLRCMRWQEIRPGMMRGIENTSRGNISHLLGGKPEDAEESWAPKMNVVKQTLKFALLTRRFEQDIAQENTPSSNNTTPN